MNGDSTHASPAPHGGAGAPDVAGLDAIEADLAGVEAALERLESGDYWTDEATGEPIDSARLVADPMTRRNSD